MLKTGKHAAAVAERCLKKYFYGLEYFLGLYHDAIEDNLFSADEIRQDFINETKQMPVGNAVDELMIALDAITRRPNETYFNYIARCSQNELAKRVKIEDLIVNRYMRGDCPGQLAKRYDKALQILRGF